VPREWRAQPVGKERGIALEESQSLLIEMIVCRSRPFLEYLRPLLEKHFGVSGPEWEQDNLYRLLTQVRRSAIRVDADELTYPLHVVLRYGIEKDLLDGRLAVRDLPDAWNAGMKAYLGVDVPDAARGVLQDVHWSLGLVGYFPTYVIGSIASAQIWEKTLAAIPDLSAQIGRGEFQGLREWLRDHLHRHGRKFTPKETLRKVTGTDTVDVGPYVAYLRRKFGDIYGLPA